MAHLERFLLIHTPYGSKLSASRPAQDRELQTVFSRKGKPHWSEEDFQELLQHLAQCGYRKIDPERVKQELELLARGR